MRDSPTEENADDSEISDEVRQQTNKRITLNLLIQGAAMHSFLTSHHLVRDELEAIRKGLTKKYDKFSVSLALNYFIGDIVILFGRPSKFWKRVREPTSPFHQHHLLATYGPMLWKASKKYMKRRGWRKWVFAFPFLHYIQMLFLLFRVYRMERGNKKALARAAELANSRMWGIDTERLSAELTIDVAFGNLQTPKTRVGRMTRKGAIGYGGVVRRGEKFQVVAKAWNWSLVAHELTKGTVELICLHGLNELDDDTYHAVTDEADQLEYETWMLQAGSEMWRRLLAVAPEPCDFPRLMMHVARLEPKQLEHLMITVIERPDYARDLLAALGED